jgi:hypothetical protein
MYPASLGSILMGWWWVDGHDTLSCLVNLAVFLYSCDSAVCIAVCHFTYGTLHWTQLVCFSFGATLLVDGLPVVFWDHVLGSGCVYLFAVGSFKREEGRMKWVKHPFVQKSVTSTVFVAMCRNVRRVGRECGCTTNQTYSSHRWALQIQREISILRDTSRTDRPISRAS